MEAGKLYLDRCISVTKKQETLDYIINKTILGDSFATLPMLPSESIDLIIADPPYNLTKTFGNTVFSKKNESAYYSYTENWLKLVKPLLKPTGSIYVCCDWASSMIIGDVVKKLFKLKNRITWQREKGRAAKANWKNGLEDIWFATKSDNYVFNLDAVKIRKKVIAPYRENGKPKDWIQVDNKNRYRDTAPSNFWDDLTIPFWSMPENTAHPTQKPEKLLAKLILASSNAGDVICDPFVGSGTTSVVAKKLGRKYIGIEAEEQYCIWTEQRLDMASKQPQIQGFLDGVFYERNLIPKR